jgi:hypothetical protein
MNAPDPKLSIHTVQSPRRDGCPRPSKPSNARQSFRIAISTPGTNYENTSTTSTDGLSDLCSKPFLSARGDSFVPFVVKVIKLTHG